MKYLVYLLLVIILVSCTTKNNSIENEADITKFDSELNVWLEFYKKYNITLDKFEFSKVDSLPDLTCKVDSFDIENDIYKPFYKYSDDSSKILDIVSYNLVLELDDRSRLISFGGAVDCEVSIKDVKNNIWQRLLFLGPSYIVEDGFWLDDYKLLIVGQCKELEEVRSIPMIWFVDIKTNTIQTFKYNQSIMNMKRDYVENEKFKGSNIDFQ